jgi:hypothetical protein
METEQVTIQMGSIELEGDLTIPFEARGLVLFAHGSRSSRHSPRNKYVARVLGEAGMGTLLFELLTPDEEELDRYTGHLRFNIPLLAGPGRGDALGFAAECDLSFESGLLWFEHGCRGGAGGGG